MFMLYIDKNIESYQLCFQKGKVDNISTVNYKTNYKKSYEYRQNEWQLFIDFEK